MNLRPSHPTSRRGLCHESAFTMAEIAIALGVIAFALVAIIGILPAGLQVQKDNREETLVTQDARVLIEAIKSGGRDQTSDLGSYVVATNGIDTYPLGIPTASLVQLLSDTKNNNTIVMSAISGALANRGSDLAFRYEIRQTVTNTLEFDGSRMADQVYEVRLRFAWPVLANNTVNSEASKYVARTLISGWRTNGVFYAQQFYQELPLTNSP